MKQAILILILLFSIPALAQERYLMPKDEAARDKSFAPFRSKLIDAVKRRDAKFILSILDADIKNSFGGNDGIEEFKEYWQIESANSKFWGEFLPVIGNGGHFQAEGEGGLPIFTAPYSFTGFPDDLDAFEHSVIFGSRVNLRKAPNLTSPIVGKLSYNIVRVTNTIPLSDDAESPDWYEIETLGRLRGFVKAEYVRSPIDYRAGFQKKSGVWKMIFFIAGD
ncbi:MAG TPA: hypothetical protein DEA22_00595 [Blastocatellia bacterium]|nr:hypothetical protein [Blastocatellia bacterium]